MEFQRRTFPAALLSFGLLAALHVHNSEAKIPLSLLKKVKNLNTEAFFTRFVKQGAASPLRPPQSEIGIKPIDSSPSNGLPGFRPPPDADLNLWNTETGSITTGGAAITAASIGDPTGCQAEEASVPVKENNDPNIMYWPSCKRIPRCSGCCNSDLMECAATKVALDQIQVARLRYEPGQADFILEDFETIFMERHVDCDCRCKVQSHHCNPAIHNYLEHACECRCRNDESHTCLEAQTWSKELCKCVCPKVYGCFEDEYFSNKTCRCEPSRGSSMSLPGSPDEPLNPCLNADPPIRCRPGMAPIPFGDTCECRISSNWGDDLAALPIGQPKPPLPPIDLIPQPTTKQYHWERVPGHPQYHEVTNAPTAGPTRPPRPTRPRRPSRRPRRRGSLIPSK